ncbi:RNA methyltransferase [Aequorivita sp. CIP111184]|uniref:TrmH family RNA methyltransferase n=1 Tax=Aequorivita sp. CIP111184 TaxID=2211356 RepID=UPI000DBBDD62|nr:RNA methyltransferase [Aequorivita sp. CIP111184]SRX54150.1 tRNA (guanosine(18)-2'-O)-methyltransferase [Aequorivita sp. CIP111184]
MVSKSQTKLITSLQQKKYREQTGLFVAEGPKIIGELINENFKLQSLFTTDASQITAENHFHINDADLKKISFLKTANTSLAVFEIPKPKPMQDSGLMVALDAIRDPGNLGAIIRLCDWFGVQQIICSKDTADCFNPKVVQATMGSLARVQIHYLSLLDFFKATNIPIYGGFMDGKNVYSEKLPKDAIIVMGNEANGISEEIIQQITQKITIPRFGKTQKTESLNVATATAILLSEFRRSTET